MSVVRVKRDRPVASFGPDIDWPEHEWGTTKLRVQMKHSMNDVLDRLAADYGTNKSEIIRRLLNRELVRLGYVCVGGEA